MQRTVRGSTVRLATPLLLVAGLLTGPPAMSAHAAGGSVASQIDLPSSVSQLVTVTSDRWSDTSASIRVWRRRGDSWRLVRGPVRASLGWNGFVRAKDWQQSSGTTPAGRFTMRSVFGTRADPGSLLPYRRVDGNDFWPYEPRDPATYNIFQPSKAATSHWRSDYAERLSDYPYEYAYSIVLGFNLPRGVRWSAERSQYVARESADTSRGGGIFLHVKEKGYTAGCVSAPIRQVRWLVRWLDPDLEPADRDGPSGLGGAAVLEGTCHGMLPVRNRPVKTQTPTSIPTWASTERPGPSPHVSAAGPEACRPFAGIHRARISRPAKVVIHQRRSPSKPSRVLPV